MSSAKKMHHRARWEPMTELCSVIRSSIGGYPILPEGCAWPVCTEDGCNRRMSAFFQFEIGDGMGLPFERGSTLGVFQCLRHDDPFEDLDTRFPSSVDERLPANYWHRPNYAMLLSSPSSHHQSSDREPCVTYAKLVLEREREPAIRSHAALNFADIKIGGSPFWVHSPKLWRCSCGSEMDFVCSVPANLRFPKDEVCPCQTNGPHGSYHLFLGLSTYVFACRAHCDPRAVVAVRQN
ncbi:MAG: hypothetical protein ABSD74_04690 [Rhizomicrobium sp.]|jgi:hypothetical protein